MTCYKYYMTSLNGNETPWVRCTCTVGALPFSPSSPASRTSLQCGNASAWTRRFSGARVDIRNWGTAERWIQGVIVPLCWLLLRLGFSEPPCFDSWGHRTHIVLDIALGDVAQCQGTKQWAGAKGGQGWQQWRPQLVGNGRATSVAGHGLPLWLLGCHQRGHQPRAPSVSFRSHSPLVTVIWDWSFVHPMAGWFPYQ